MPAPSAPWTLFVGLGMLWLALVALTPMVLLLVGWTLAVGATDAISVVLDVVLPLLLVAALGVILVLAGLGRRWARWTAVLLAAAAAGAALLSATGTAPVPVIIAVALASAFVGAAVLLSLPVTGRWYRGRARRKPVP